MAMHNWEKKHVWHLSGPSFVVEVYHYSEKTESKSLCFIASENDGPHRWCVYAYIYLSHPRFSKLVSENLWQDATEGLPLHGGCSFFNPYLDGEGKCVSIKIGCDYSHLHDLAYTWMDENQPEDVLSDAENLFDILKEEYASAQSAT